MALLSEPEGCDGLPTASSRATVLGSPRRCLRTKCLAKGVTCFAQNRSSRFRAQRGPSTNRTRSSFRGEMSDHGRADFKLELPQWLARITSRNAGGGGVLLR